MKKLNSIDFVSFKEKDDKLYFEEIPITIGIEIIKWLEEYCNINYSFISYLVENPELEILIFNDFPNIEIKLYNKIVRNIIIYPYQYQSSPYYKGDIFIFGKKLKVPFRSENIEEYFPDIKIKSKGYFNRFIPRETIDYPLINEVEIEMTMGRDPDLVGSISLKKEKQ